MTDLGPLFAQPYPLSPGYARDSATSREAAAAVLPKMRPLHEAILAMLVTAPLTADELAAKLDRHLLVVRPRLSEMRELGYVEPTDEIRPSALGNSMRVMRITDAGIKARKDAADSLHAATVTAAAPSTHATSTLKNGTHAR